MKKISFFAVIALCFSLTTTAAFAAVGDQTVSRSGNDYVVETVTAESTDANGVKTQIVERKTIPWYLYNPNNPRVPLTPPAPPTPNPDPKPVPPMPPEPKPSAKVLKLRAAALESFNDLKDYGYLYQWETTTEEDFVDNKKLEAEVTFILSRTANADNLKAIFDQKVTFKKGGKTKVKYFKDGVEYSVQSIKNMLRDWGKRR